MTIEEQLAEAEAENRRLKDERISIIRAKIAALQVQLDALLMERVAELEAINSSLYEDLVARRAKRKPSPLKGRKILEDYECAVSTAIKRLGGIKIPKDLREEFGGWARLHCNEALAVDELAEELHELGLIAEPTTNALLDGLKSGRKSARVSDRSIDAYWAEEGRKLAQEQEGDSCPF